MCHVTRNSLRLCCVDQSGTSIQILQEPRDTFFFFYKITTLLLNISEKISLAISNNDLGYQLSLYVLIQICNLYVFNAEMDHLQFLK